MYTKIRAYLCDGRSFGGVGHEDGVEERAGLGREPPVFVVVMVFKCVCVRVLDVKDWDSVDPTPPRANNPLTRGRRSRRAGCG